MDLPSAVLACLLAVPAARGGTELDSILDVFLNRCEATERFMSFENRIRARFALSPIGGVDSPVPQELREAADAARLIKKSPEAYHVRVPLSGTFRGLEVSALDFLWGDHNGIYAASIVFREPMGRVEAAIGPSVEAQQTALRELEKQQEESALRGGGAVGMIPTLSLGTWAGVAELGCDWST